MAAYRTKVILGLSLIMASVLAYMASTRASDMVKSSNVPNEAAILQSRQNAADPAIAKGFVPHKAIYDIRLAGKKSGSQILNISGQMLYDWSSNCEAWNSNHKFNMIYEYADTPPMRMISDYSLYEMFDGSRLDFSSTRKNDNEILEELRGTATFEENAGKAIFRLPQNLSFDLGENTVFPMRHSLDVLEKMRAGKKFYNAVIFDGSDQDGPVEINAFIGGSTKPPEKVLKAKGVDTELLNSPSHSIRLAFFPLMLDQAEADYEMSMVFHENGIISDMTIEYSDFSVSQTLVALEKSTAHCTPQPDITQPQE